MNIDPRPVYDPMRRLKQPPRVYRPEKRNPRQMGRKAFLDGADLAKNPFDNGTGQRRRWIAGWRDAAMKATEIELLANAFRKP